MRGSLGQGRLRAKEAHLRLLTPLRRAVRVLLVEFITFGSHER